MEGCDFPIKMRWWWGPNTAAAAVSSSSKAIGLVFVVLLAGTAFFSARWFNTSTFTTTTITSIFSSTPNQALTNHPSKPKPPTIIPFTCPAAAAANQTTTTTSAATTTCPSASTLTIQTLVTEPPTPPPTPSLLPPPSCPDYFRWIHEDLRPWNSTGISKETVESGKDKANFRLVVVDGRAYLDRYHGAFQTRDVFTLWGFVQLLRRYPGRVPDFDLMFNLDDPPMVRSDDYVGANKSAPPPLFRYCKDHSTLDIVFPDWSFWGWPEVNIKPWETLLEELKEGNEKVKWRNRKPYAYWKGNPGVAGTRQDLMKCNVSKDIDWNARLYAQDWVSEGKRGFKDSDLASQCTHRYKIYIEGRAWSVSEKYILACDSPTLLVKTQFQDFFSRGLMPGRHYLPIRDDDKCRSIKSAVDWGNSHRKKAQAIGKGGSGFIQEELKMEYVYEYMLHLLTEYSKLLTYKPSKPEKAIELCSESMACPAEGKVKTYMMESMVRAPHDSEPCALPPSFQPAELKDFLTRKDQTATEVEKWMQKSSGKRRKQVQLILLYLPWTFLTLFTLTTQLIF